MKRNKTGNEMRELVNAYDLLVEGIDHEAEESEGRAYGGVIRAGKGTLVEGLARKLVSMAWRKLGGKESRFLLARQGIRIPINSSYVRKIKSPEENIQDFYYTAKTDVHVSIDGKFVMGIECKAYTENAMFKRILVDFTLLKQANKDLDCVLFQLESQLGGDYGEISKDIIYGSASTHTLMSYFDVDLSIITLLEGERKVDKPIHKKEYAKSLKKNSLVRALNFFEERLRKYS